MENRVASKLALLFKWDGGDFWNSELISHSLNPLFIQPGICCPTHPSTVQPVEGGWVWSNSLEGHSSRRALRFHAKLLFPWASSACCWSNPAIPRGGAPEHCVWGVHFSRTVSLLDWQSHAVFPGHRSDLRWGWKKREGQAAANCTRCYSEERWE